MLKSFKGAAAISALAVGMMAGTGAEARDRDHDRRAHDPVRINPYNGDVSVRIAPGVRLELGNAYGPAAGYRVYQSSPVVVYQQVPVVQAPVFVEQPVLQPAPVVWVDQNIDPAYVPQVANQYRQAGCVVQWQHPEKVGNQVYTVPSRVLCPVQP